MFGRIYAIALNTFREAVRKRFLYAVVFLVVGLNLFATILGEMSLHQEARVARDVGLGAISLLGSLTAIILGAVLLYNEVQRRTIHTIISKPLHRWEFVLGKYLGMAMTLTLLVGLFALAMAGLLTLQEVTFNAAVVKAVVLGYMEILVVASVAVFFSSFSSPVLSGVFTASLWRLGHCTPELRSFAGSADSDVARHGYQATLHLVPDLHLFTVSGGAVQGEHVSVHGDFVSWGYVATSTGYGVLYVTALLLLAALIFSYRDFA
jgi:ABC-type transport system involved in multi-copper enzyme maturation permease subunit